MTPYSAISPNSTEHLVGFRPMKPMFLIQEEIAQKQFKVLRCFMDTVSQVIVVCPGQQTPKISYIFHPAITNMRIYSENMSFKISDN